MCTGKQYFLDHRDIGSFQACGGVLPARYLGCGFHAILIVGFWST
jgi:hypothetical protein